MIASIQFEFLLEETVVVGEVKPEQREGLRAGTAPEDHFGGSGGESIQGRVPLKDPHRVVRAQHCHRRPQVDA
jgi:hypothetical protein